MPKTVYTAALFACLVGLTGCKSDKPTTEHTLTAVTQDTAEDAKDDGFVSLFNGKDLTGWTPKIRTFDLGEDPKQTFRVVDGVIQVNYSNYDKFDRQFGHLFCDTQYSSYILRLEYRFLGDKQIDGNPGGWAYMNSGVMIHGEDPKAMPKNKEFPDSMEVQLLGQKKDGPERSTANLCTPGTHYVDLDDKLVKRHCVTSSSKTYRGEQWVQLEIEVHGSEKVIHRVNGEVVFEYVKPQLNDGTLLEKGSISLQSESHACEFRNIEIKVLEK
jgi:hypothetical protein